MSYQYKKNIYRCQICYNQIITIDRDSGVTPFMIRCRESGCIGTAQSLLYRVGLTVPCSHEWYRPDVAEFKTLDRNTQEHVRQGGLLLREIPPIPLPESLSYLDEHMAPLDPIILSPEQEAQVEQWLEESNQCLQSNRSTPSTESTPSTTSTKETQ